MSSFLANHTRTHSCGELRAADAGKHVVLTGWVQTYRDHGERIFIDLRDRDGVTQVVADRTRLPAVHELADTLRSEWCIGIAGEVRLRGEQLAKGEPGAERKMRKMTNEKIATGEVEVWIDELEVFSKSETPPFAIEDDIDTNDQLRFKYRYLDLRRPKIQKNLIARSQMTRTTRDYLSKHGFLEIETPFMVKYTPGGARNFWCRRGSTRAASTRSPSRRRSSSSC